MPPHVAHTEWGAGSRREREDAAAPRSDESVPMLAEDRDHRGVDDYPDHRSEDEE
jgi:hypothetical protein